jgi:hypothetical protein
MPPQNGSIILNQDLGKDESLSGACYGEDGASQESKNERAPWIIADPVDLQSTPHKSTAFHAVVV